MEEDRRRDAKDFGFDFMVYEDPLVEHSTNFEWRLAEGEAEDLKVADLILAMRVASNSRKDLTIVKPGLSNGPEKQNDTKQKEEKIRLEFMKKL